MDCLYKNPNQPIEARVNDLLSRMTLKEKIAQMTQIERTVATPSVITDLSIGTLHPPPPSAHIHLCHEFEGPHLNLCLKSWNFDDFSVSLLCFHFVQGLISLEVGFNLSDPN